jgi:hypothetical protein
MVSLCCNIIVSVLLVTVLAAPQTHLGLETNHGPSQVLHPSNGPSQVLHIPTEAFPYNRTLDDHGEFVLFWKFNDSHITFEVHVKTRGYVGFGISPNGKMYPAEIVIGWVKDGHAHLTVCVHLALIENRLYNYVYVRGTFNKLCYCII